MENLTKSNTPSVIRTYLLETFLQCETLIMSLFQKIPALFSDSFLLLRSKIHFPKSNAFTKNSSLSLCEDRTLNRHVSHMEKYHCVYSSVLIQYIYN